LSFYNIMSGVNQTTFFFLPMLGKHPDEYPRFRNCFLGDDANPEYDNHIHVYTRTGGGNREDYRVEIDTMRAMPEYVTDWDDSFDSTYASWVFRVPEKWQKDFEALISCDMNGVSAEYRDQMNTVFPKLAEKFDALFSTK